jgi:hypothetical protein
MSFNQLANQDFERAVFRGFWRKLLARFTGENIELLPYDEVREKLPFRGQHYLGMQQVPIDKIVGSVGRYQDFDRAFLPTQTRTRDRWVSIDKAHYDQINLPPVELFKMGEIYFVKDGNHRVSVARERGQVFLDAFVTEVDIPVALTTDTKVDDLALKKDYGEFLLKTDLVTSHPEARIESSVAGQYERLLEHISVHRWYLGEQRGSDVSFQEAASSWYEHVYCPLVEILRDLSVAKDFPGTSEADLYLWIMEYQGYLKQAYRDEEVDGGSARQEAAKELLEGFPYPAVKKLVNALSRKTWVDELILRQERAAFLEYTRLAEVRPEANVETTLPGKYELLREHIAVHRWYLGEHRQSEVPLPEAVASWYDQVYLPIVEIIREQGVLKEFPGRTETDLYLWVVEHRGYLQEIYQEDVPIQQAVADYSQRAGKKVGRSKRTNHKDE